MKAEVAAFNQEKALVGAFSAILQLQISWRLVPSSTGHCCARPGENSHQSELRPDTYWWERTAHSYRDCPVQNRRPSSYLYWSYRFMTISRRQYSFKIRGHKTTKGNHKDIGYYIFIWFTPRCLFEACNMPLVAFSLDACIIHNINLTMRMRLQWDSTWVICAKAGPRSCCRPPPSSTMG